MKKRIIIVMFIIVIGITITMLYNTFATSSTVLDNYEIVINNSKEEVMVPANSIKTVYYKVENINKGKVQYGVIYKGENITVKVYDDTVDEAVGIFDYEENKFIKLCIINSGTTESTVTIKAVLGYEYGGDLIIPSGYSLVNTTYNNYTGLAKYINDLYLTHSKEIVSNNNINYNYATSVNLMSDRLGCTTEDLDSGNIRYYGASPNNYIYFNCDDYSNQTSDTCELWRIIGVFDGKVKIIRDAILDDLCWDYDYNDDQISTTRDNNWQTSSLNALLNGDYYNNKDTIYYSYDYNNSSTITNTVDFNSKKIGIKNDITRDFILETYWFLGGHNSKEVYSNEIYTYERGTNVYPGRPISWTGKIALAYPSDYGYASNFNYCVDVIGSTSGTDCKGNNWMNTSNWYWLITPKSSNSEYVLGVQAVGGLGDFTRVGKKSKIRPVLYLNYNIAIQSGDGSQSNPYRLS